MRFRPMKRNCKQLPRAGDRFELPDGRVIKVTAALTQSGQPVARVCQTRQVRFIYENEPDSSTDLRVASFQVLIKDAKVL